MDRIVVRLATMTVSAPCRSLALLARTMYCVAPVRVGWSLSTVAAGLVACQRSAPPVWPCSAQRAVAFPVWPGARRLFASRSDPSDDRSADNTAAPIEPTGSTGSVTSGSRLALRPSAATSTGSCCGGTCGCAKQARGSAASDRDSRSAQIVADGLSKRAFATLVAGSLAALCADTVRAATAELLTDLSIASFSPTGLQIDLTQIPLGSTFMTHWCGRSIFVRHRTPEEVAAVRAVPLSELRDPQTDEQRCARPEWLVVVGVCPHMGCLPVLGGDFGGFVCPCHHSHFDASGRVRRGPSMFNLEVPVHSFSADGRVLLVPPPEDDFFRLPITDRSTFRAPPSSK